MKITVRNGNLIGKPGAIAVCLFEDEVKSLKLAGLNKKTVDELKKLIKSAQFSGGKKETLTHFAQGTQAPLLILQGLGERSEFTWLKLRHSVGSVIREAKGNKAKSLALFSAASFDSDLEADTTAKAIVDALVLGHWSFEHYKSAKKPGHAVANVDVYFSTLARKNAATKVIPAAQIMAEAHNLSRDYGTHPTNVVTTDYLKAEAQKLSKQGVKVSTLERNDLKKLGMNLILAVGQASVMPPRVIIMDYNPRGAKKSLALVGKGLVFDTGGLNIKVAMMEEMKSDMCGAAAVLAAMHAVAKLKPQQRVIGVIGTCENAISGDAYRPSDIYTAYDGKTVEIGNTDAEGRLVLADTMAYIADKYKPSMMVDVATLTGAAKIALGNHADGVMSNSERVSKQVLAAAERAFERMWPLPLYEEYGDEMRSAIADLNNTGPDRWGGASRAGAFLQEFVGKTPWAHIDIAPTSYPALPSSLNPRKTANGSATKTLIELAIGE